MDFSKASTVTIVACSITGVVLLLILVYLVYRVYKKRCAYQAPYEKIYGRGAGGKEHTTVDMDRKNVPQLTVNSRNVQAFVLPSTPPKKTRQFDRPVVSPRMEGTSGALGVPIYPDSGSDSSSPPSRRSSTEGPQNSMFSLGAIDPDLYKATQDDSETNFPEDHLGRVWFALEYQREAERLLVSLIKIKNLPSRTPGSSNACDPFVKIFLLPDERRFVQSKFKRKTTNPKFDESFVFQVSYKALQTRTLRLTVYDVDRHKKHRTLGNVLYPFKDFDYDDGQKIVLWKDLEEKSNMETSDLGEVQFSLTYNNHLERLTVVVLRARGVKKLAGMAAVDSCARVTLMNSNHVLKTKKTSVVTNSSDPLYNESFNFKLSPTQLDTSSLSVAIVQVTPGDEGSERQVGRVVVGPFMYARGKELEHWTEMVNNQKDMVKRWHALTQ
ncbi:synaptotagmin-15-like isoform X2 [Branchiostoma floridae]|uniref:Synaptotagmin-15-like isoform X2 n=1 Tax=Branchiostoma floridae TaxID=7739 RepID=A0A9J7KV51_BRAFL|nr:synaptotagmin-15-like isoform X2 [Branchiostoma floridae]